MKTKTVLISGGSQGIGLAIALRFAASGANVVILTKDTAANIDHAAEEITKAGGQALALLVDVSQQSEIQSAIAKTVAQFGSIDVLVNNTSATCFTDTLHTSPEQFDLIVATSARAAFLLSQACFPYLKNSENPHIINISPPLNIETQWFKDHLAFTIGKYAMSFCTVGMSVEFADAGIAVNSLWPQTTIATQTIIDHFLPAVYSGSRWPSIMGDAAYELAQQENCHWTGQFFTDESLLRKVGIVDFNHYAVDANAPLMQPLFIPLEEGMSPLSRQLFLKN